MGPKSQNQDQRYIDEMPDPWDSFFFFPLSFWVEKTGLYIVADVPFFFLHFLRRFITMRLLPWKCQHSPPVVAKVVKMKFLRPRDTSVHLDIAKATSDIFLIRQLAS